MTTEINTRNSDSDNSVIPMMHHTIDEVSRMVKAAIDAVDPAGPMDAIISLHGYTATFKREAAEWGKLAEAKFLECLKAHGTEDRPAQVEVGAIRFYAGETKTVKPKSHKVIMRTVLELSGGDDAAIEKCLSANAWCYGKVRTLIEDNIADTAKAEAKFNECFTTAKKSTLEEGKPDKKIKAVNPAFLR